MSLPEIDLSQGTLIEIGAGSAPGLDALLDGPHAPARVVLIEPHAATAKALASRFAAKPQVTVLDVAIGTAAASGETVLQVANNLAHSSLRMPLPALQSLLPGLRLVKSQPVEVLSAGELMTSLGQLPHPVHIRIDAPGAEQDILMSLHQSGDLETVDSVDLRAGSEALYDGALGSDALRDWLSQKGFLLQAVSTEDPDWPETRLVVDHGRRDMQRKLAAAEAAKAAQAKEIADLSAAAKTLEGKLKQHDDLAEAKHQEAEAMARRFAEMERALAATSQGLEAKSKALGVAEAALAEAKRALTDSSAAAEAAAKAAAASAVADQLASEAKIKGLTDLAATRATRIAEVERALATVTQDLEAKGKALAEADAARRRAEEQSLAALQKQTRQTEAAEAETAKIRQDLLIAMRLQAIAIGDLRDLQVKFAETQEIKTRQEELLRQLTPRLQEASAQLRELMALPASGALPALTGEKAGKGRKKAKDIVKIGKSK